MRRARTWRGELNNNSSVALKYLGVWLAAERASNGTDRTFSGVVGAYRQRLAVARALFPRAQLAVYGSPAQVVALAADAAA